MISRVSSRDTVVTGSYAGDLFSNSLVQNSWLMESESLELKYIREDIYFKGKVRSSYYGMTYKG